MRENIIKILHVVGSLQIGGLENILINIINNTNPEIFEHSICCINRSGPMARRIEKHIIIHEMKKGGKADYLLPIKILDVIRKDNPDIVHTRNWSAIDGIIAAALSRNRKIIHDEHGRDCGDPKGLNIKKKIIRNVLDRYVDRYVVVSDELRDWLNTFIGIQNRKIVRIQNSVDTRIFSPPVDKGREKIAVGLPANSCIVGYVGRLDPVKNLEMLMKSFLRVIMDAHSDKQILLVITGSGAEEEKLKKTTHEWNLDGKVFFLGESSNVNEYMRAMDIFAISSIAEGIPLTLLEAMASGLPVVATRVGGIGEVVQDKESGYLVDSGDDRGFAEKLEKYISDESLRECHGRKGRELVVKLYSLDNMIRQYENLYLEVMGERRSN